MSGGYEHGSATEPPGLLVAVAAHADDAEIQAGGLMAKWRARGGSVAIVMVTDNRSGELLGPGGDKRRLPPEETTAVRHREQAAAAAMLGAEIHHLGYPQRHCWNGARVVSVGYDNQEPGLAVSSGLPPLLVAFQQPDHIRRLTDLLVGLRPARVVTQIPVDIDPEHHAVCSMVWQAFEMAGESLAACELQFWAPGTSCPDGTYDPGFDVIEDISDVYETKLALCRCHGSQMTAERWSLVEKRAREWGAAIGVEYAEPFKSASRSRFIRPPAGTSREAGAAAKLHPSGRGSGGRDSRLAASDLLVAVSAHADDAELNAGGLMAKWRARGGSVAIIMVTDNCSGALMVAGGNGAAQYCLPPEETTALRHREQEAAAGLLGAEVHYLGYPQRHYWDGEKKVSIGFAGSGFRSPEQALHAPLVIAFRQRETVRRMADLLLRLNPRRVVTQISNDLDPEHLAVCSLVWQAFVLESEKLASVSLQFWSPGTGITAGTFDPGFDHIEDISSYFAEKLELCRAHPSQMTSARLAGMEARARAWGQVIGVEFAEPYKTARRPPGSPVRLPALSSRPKEIQFLPA